jgi:hypothetical protein
MNDPAAIAAGSILFRQVECSVFYWLDISKQGEDEDDDQDCPKSADRIVAPTRAVRPGGHGADDQNDQNDEDNEPHFGLCLGRPLARGRPNNAKIRETFPLLRSCEHQQIA